MKSETNNTLVITGDYNPLYRWSVSGKVNPNIFFYCLHISPQEHISILIASRNDVWLVSKTDRNEALWRGHLGVKRIPSNPVGPKVLREIVSSEE